MRAILLVAAVGAMLTPLVANAAPPPTEVRVLSAAAVNTGLTAVSDLFQRRSGRKAVLEFATGPEIRQRLLAGETRDVVIAPEDVLKDLQAAHRLGGAPFPLGRVGISVAVRDGAPRPDIASVEAFKAAVLAADTVVYSRGTSGAYLEALMPRLGLAGPIAARTVRVDNGGAVVARLVKGNGSEIGLSALTELALGEGKGLVVVGPLPPAIQHYTTYAAAAGPAAARAETTDFVALLRGAEGQALMKANGID